MTRIDLKKTNGSHRAASESGTSQLSIFHCQCHSAYLIAGLQLAQSLKSISMASLFILYTYTLFFSLHVFAQTISTNTPVPPLQWLNLSSLVQGSSQPPPLKDSAIGYDESRFVLHPPLTSFCSLTVSPHFIQSIAHNLRRRI